ncbi:hypothetical protein K469DRAFT_695278 [Zopfia rhizophila CBS 207.26]|uniref:Zn(2)-C6 fungal-type domain-containing protein n=1 Tax=Zopfia rhizophila CBS 207.26 TaxID=1314779 RepID=A0A6A6DH12_9PEZI|nr:hypothetical protein K469DRAFT_695278 [Zopfia rhizophila CBS 207.26]
MFPQRATGKRRSHRKSRKGCLECKRRRIKCNEEDPCGNCVRRGMSCVYSLSLPTSTPTAPASSSISVLGAAQSTSPQSTSGAKSYSHCGTPQPWAAPSPFPSLSNNAQHDSFAMDDLVLLHHWSVATSLTIVNTPAVDHIWQIVFVRVGFQHPYVMHGILSLAALHLAYLDPLKRRSLIAMAADHHNKALPGFQTDIRHINQSC